jgi:hypothetical protein
MEHPSINDIDCPAAEQLEDAMAHLSQLHFLLGVHVLRLRSAAYEKERKRAQRARKHPIEAHRPVADTTERLAG